MAIIRAVLGKIILFLDALFSPQATTRTPAQQAACDEKTKAMVIYQLVACPFCVKVRRHVKRLALNIPYKNIEEKQNYDELMAGGKLDQVPCLRILNPNGSAEWLYESDDINAYLSKLTS